MSIAQLGEDRKSLPWGLIFWSLSVGKRAFPGDPVWDPSLKEDAESVWGDD